MVKSGSYRKADVCLILEGTYPYVTGGVSGWAHDLIQEQSHLSFHLLVIVPRDAELELKYQLPANVVGLTTVRLNHLPEGSALSPAAAKKLHAELREPIARLTGEKQMKLDALAQMMQTLSRHRNLGVRALLDDEHAWKHLVALYEQTYPDQSFLDYFWSHRAIIGGLYSMLLAPLPPADIYHAMSTGYAGLLAARAKIETGRTAIVTEHGIYTNERRVELTAADWLESTASRALTVDKPRNDLRDMWIEVITNFSAVAYEAADHIVTLYKGNQAQQLRDGAMAEKMQIIPNGIDVKRYGALQRQRQSSPTIGLIGRVVPIKDTKTFIRACSLLRQAVPDLKAYIVGPTDEDAEYYQECLSMAQMLGVEENITFTGHARVEDYLPQIDVLVLTSVSEAQPLVILEAGVAGIPSVATDVGACRELIEGREDESPALGAGGIVTPLASPAATAEAIYTLLSDEGLRERAGEAMRQRVQTYYSLTLLHQSYRNLYAQYLRR